MNGFINRLRGEFRISELERQIDAIAMEYHERTEAYDQTVCSGIRDGIAMPATNEEFGLINRNALKVRKELLARVLSIGGTKDQFHEAIQNTAKRFERGLKKRGAK